MKRILLFTFILGFVVSSFAQTRVSVPAEFKNKAEKDAPAILETNNTSNEVLAPGAASYKLVEEADMGKTWYDLQSNTSMQNRIHFFEDGTIGGVYTYGLNHPGFDDRGTGYNYFDGSAWGPASTGPLELDRTGWPAYAPFGENGEIVVSHYSGAAVDGLAITYRGEKGTGDWTHMDFSGPAGNEGLLWPRMATGGVDNSVIHMIPITTPVANGGALYEGVDGAILYSRSIDGGVTWDPENLLLDGVGADYFVATSGDTYEIQARGDVVAFLTGDSWTDLIMMKSEDGGDTWEQTVIWENPYPLFDPAAPFATDTFYCPDGAHSLAIDQGGKVHVAFGINRGLSDGATLSWFPLVDGLGYWNEDRATFSNDVDALNPYDDAVYTELVEDHSLIGWAQDVNGNGTWDILGEVGLYYVGTSSMPTIHIDDMNRVFVVWAGLTETFDNGLQDYRRLWARASTNGGDWWGDFFDLTGGLIHVFDECIFPSISHNSDDYIYLNYQLDTEPGLAVRGDEDPYGENTINFMKVLKTDILSGIENKVAIEDFDVSQVSPNPVSGQAEVKINVRKNAELSVEISNLMGQVVYTANEGAVAPGMTRLSFDASNLSQGVYFYTINAGETSVTRKFIVE